MGFDNFYSQTLASSISDTDTTITVSSAPTASEGYLVIEPESSSNREIIYYTSKSGSDLVLPSVGAGRGVGGTSAKAHSSGAVIKSNIVAEHFEALQDGTGLATGAISTAKIAADAVTAAKIDWASTGADAGIWWEELGRHTLSGTADVMQITSFGARKHLLVMLIGIATGGTINANVTFNNDTGNNYNRRNSFNGAADATSLNIASVPFAAQAGAYPVYTVARILNIATENKLITLESIQQNTAGAGTAGDKMELVGKWANTTDQITRIDVTNTGTGDFASGSEVVVVGHN